MKVLILSCSTGEGHNSAARALLKGFENAGVECVFTDPVGFQSERAKKIVASAYNNLIAYTPSFFGAVYKAGMIYNSSPLPSPIYHANAHYSQKLYEYIKENGFDTVVCTHVYAMEAISAIYAKHKTNFKSYGIFTDYTYSPFINETKMTSFFIPHEELLDEVTKKGIPMNKIYCSGIPVHPKFSENISKQAAREYLKIPKDKNVILVMTGGIGSKNTITLLKNLVKKIGDDTFIYVLSGKNSYVKKSILNSFGDLEFIKVVSFTKKVYYYMKSADVLISKPGGISSSEAAATGVALIHAMAIPGCETKNAEFFEKHGMSINANNLSFAASEAIRLINCPNEREKMINNQKNIIHSDATSKIIEKIMENNND